jgi:tight adherence protein C
MLEGQTFIYAVATLTLFGVLGFGGGLWIWLNPRRTAQDRLQEMTTTSTEAPRPSGSSRLAAPVQQAIARVAAPQDGEEHDALKKELIQAGYRRRNNVELYSALRMSLAVALPLLWVLFPSKASNLQSVGVTIVLAGAGYWAPGLMVTNGRQKRQTQLLKTFPDALDMLVASVEAGLGLDASFRRIADEMTSAAPLLCAELKQVNNEVGGGVPRVEALQHLSHRTGLDEITALVNVLVQAERFGTPVARSLRIHSEMVRTRRMQRAEEAAAKISPKLTVAMILFMLPCLIIVLIGPAVVNVVRNLLPALGS